jgi:ABC-type sugar transport system permease subunit
MGSVPFRDPASFVVLADLPITVLAAVGLRRLWQRQRVFALWLLLAFAFLVAWPTKWPQYLLVLSAPLSLSAGYGARMALEPVGRWLRGLTAAARGLFGRGRARGRGEARGRGFRGTLRDMRSATPWLAPGIIALLFLAVIPIVYEVAISLTDLRLNSLRDGINGGVLREVGGGLTGQIPAAPIDFGSRDKEVNYVGFQLLDAYQRGIWLGGQTSASFAAFSLLWMVLSVGLQAAFGIAVALVLERPGVRYAGWWRTLFILPWAIPEVVGAVAWRDIVQPEHGLIAQLLGTPTPLLASPDLALLVLLLASVWMGWPLWMLVATAGLRAIPRAYVDAAALDGAGRLRTFASITLPLLLPLLSAAFIVRGVAAFNQFYLFWVIGPPDATITLSTFSFFVFSSTNGPGLYSVSAAINVITLLALAVVVVWFLRWRSRAERVAFA